MPKTDSTTLIGSADAARILHIDRSTLTRWVKRGKLVPALTGTGTTGEMFFHAADIEAATPVDKPSPLEKQQRTWAAAGGLFNADGASE